jgi:hypothetical protein
MTSSSSVVPWAALAPEHRVLSLGAVRRAARSFRPPEPRPTGLRVVDARPAATLVLVVERDGEAAVVFTKRPPSMRQYGDDWVLPGGTVAGVDVDAAAGARREAS